MRKSGKNAYILLTAPDGSTIELSGLATDGRSRSNQYAMEFDFDTKRAGGFEQDWKESVPVGSSLWQAGVFAFYNAADDEVEDFLTAMHEAQHAPADCTDAGEYTLTISPEGECEGKSRYTLAHAVLMRLDMPELPGSLLKIGALFGGWQASQEVIGGVLVATTKGLYKSAPFYFDDSEATWERLGQELDIRAAFFDHSDPDALQVGIVGSGVDSEVWLRRPSAGDDWVRILTTDEAVALTPQAPSDKQQLIWAAHHDGTVYATLIAKGVGGKYLVRTSDYGDNWAAYDLSATYTVGRVDVYEASGLLYISICDIRGAKGVLITSSDGESRDTEFVGDAGGWAPDFFIEQDTGEIICGLEDNTADTPRLVASDNEYELPIDDEAVRAGVISPQQSGFSPVGALWRDGDTIRTLRRNILYMADYGEEFTTRVISELDTDEALAAKALAGIAGPTGPKLIFGRNPNTVDTPDVVFATIDDGVTVWGKGGANADQEDGGDDSIPYTASVAWNGICII